MTITIEIDCETIQDFYTHLHVIRKEIKQACKKHKLDFFEDEFSSMEWEDNNCYGTHEVKILEEGAITLKTPNQ